MSDALFEIGTEELPATNLADIFGSSKETVLETRLRKAFEDQRLGFESCRVFATPRRLVFYLKEVEAGQSAKESLVRGPAKEVAFDAEGQPNEKLTGFLRSKNATLEDIRTETVQGKEYVVIRKKETARGAAELLPEIFTTLVKSLHFPKNMRWDASGLHFPRPIRSYACFYGLKPLKFKIGRTPVSPKTFLFSKAKRTAHAVKNIAAYFALLRKKGVILDPSERKKSTQALLERSARSLKLGLHGDPFLLNEVTFLTETPDVLAASFDAQFLKLPQEVLTVSMARKQRLFGVLDPAGHVAPKFLAVLDGRFSSAEKAGISENIAHILRAKLQDSLFFYEEDVKTGLEKKRKELAGLIFLKGAGSMLEKSDRLMKLARDAVKELKLSAEEAKTLERAAFLSKADLLTHMVGEFPELQGVMGKYYALEAGEPQAVAEAIGEQYLPRTVDDPLPATLPGSLLSVLDKCDLISACFRLGLEPTSSLDPYGLRRAATAVLKILIDKKLKLALSNLLEPADKRLEAFFKDRFKALLADRGFAEEWVEAVMATRFEQPYEVFERARSLAALARDSHFPKAWKVVERTANILKGNKDALPAAIRPEVFTEALEREVFKNYEASRAPIQEAVRACDFQRATSLYAEAFFDILGEFFDKVFVNADDSDVRQNRLLLLKTVKDLYAANVADLSKIHTV